MTNAQAALPFAYVARHTADQGALHCARHARAKPQIVTALSTAECVA